MGKHVLMVFAAALALVIAACFHTAALTKGKTAGEPRRLEPTSEALPDSLFPQPGPTAADNSRCYVCHINFATEELTLVHAKGGVGCEKCHGLSDPHCSDEDNITPPDIMYPRGEINAACMKCHPRAEIGRVPEHKETLAAASGPKTVCTDCHGEHRLAHRTRRWDRKTRKLIEDDNVRMIRAENLK